MVRDFELVFSDLIIFKLKVNLLDENNFNYTRKKKVFDSVVVGKQTIRMLY